jgi:hypothetical protein
MTIQDASNAVGESPRETIAALVNASSPDGVSEETIDALTQDVPTDTTLMDAGIGNALLPLENVFTEDGQALGTDLTNFFYSPDPNLGIDMNPESSGNYGGINVWGGGSGGYDPGSGGGGGGGSDGGAGDGGGDVTAGDSDE